MLNIDFHPIVMHFAACYAGHSYGDFASDYKVLVKSNLKGHADFGMDAVGLISDPYRETAAFGAKIDFPAEAVPRCKEILVRSMEDIKLLKNPVAVIQDWEVPEIKITAEQLCKREAGRPFILSGGCEISVNTPAGHLRAMRESLQ